MNQEMSNLALLSVKNELYEFFNYNSIFSDFAEIR